MKRLLRVTLPAIAALSALLGARYAFTSEPALAAPTPATVSVSDTGLALTGTACTSLSSATDGFDLSNVTGWRIVASSPSGQTFTAGTAVCCYRSPKLARWMACNSALNLTLAAARDTVSLDAKTYVGQGRLKFVGSGVTLSGAGTTFDVTFEASQR